MFKKRSELFDCNLIYFLILSMFVIIRIISSTFTIDTVMSYILNITIQIVLAFCLPVFLFSYLRKQKIKKTFTNYGFKKTSPKAITLSLFMGLLVYILTIFIASFFTAVLHFLGYEKLGTPSEQSEFPIWLLVIELITTAVLPAICEEVANRGMLISCYKKLGAKKAILISGLLFGLMHLNINQFFYATIIGFYFGFVVLLCDNIWPAIIMHFTNNAISTFMGFASTNGLAVSKWLENLLNLIITRDVLSGIFMLFLFISIIVVILFALTRVLCKETRVKQLTYVADKMLKTQLRNELMKDFVEVKDEPVTNDTGILLTQHKIGGRTVFNIDFSKQISDYKPYIPTKKEELFLYANIFLGVIVTVFTFIWGIL